MKNVGVGSPKETLLGGGVESQIFFKHYYEGKNMEVGYKWLDQKMWRKGGWKKSLVSRGVSIFIGMGGYNFFAET